MLPYKRTWTSSLTPDAIFIAPDVTSSSCCSLLTLRPAVQLSTRCIVSLKFSSAAIREASNAPLERLAHTTHKRNPLPASPLEAPVGRRRVSVGTRRDQDVRLVGSLDDVSIVPEYRIERVARLELDRTDPLIRHEQLLQRCFQRSEHCVGSRAI